ncbi:hypothetical protein J7E70_31200 [Variovorax paradoxus]|nr:hypothetical protein [Variovorax paradoxus]MBT2304887.1 hypothetical protein [Variovorax paradoxus]
MLPQIRHLVAQQCARWCLIGILLAALQPFIGAHFCEDGLENEGEFQVRSLSASVEFHPDERADHPTELETTLFVPSAASIDLPHALKHGIDGLMALVLLLLPLTLALVRLVETFESVVPQRVPHTSGAPPPSPTAPWRRLPPETAPPLTT